jgi:aspartyl-tRNA(Asn)/glutamyl-tRNA(Gln) amidotransferase subunit C
MSKVTTEDVKQIAALARLELSEVDIKKYQAELSNILNYVDQIEKVDTKNIEPTAQVAGLVDVVREDAKNPSEISRDEILANVPNKKEGYIKVKPVME